MNRNELLNSVDYWTQMLQIDLFELVNKYLVDNKMSKTQFAQQLGVSKGYVSQIFNGDFDHKISKMVELSLACGYVPSLKFSPVDEAEDVVVHYQEVSDNSLVGHQLPAVEASAVTSVAPVYSPVSAYSASDGFCIDKESDDIKFVA